MEKQATAKPPMPNENKPMVDEYRLTALDRSINYHYGRKGDPDKIVKTATLFEAYLRG